MGVIDREEINGFTKEEIAAAKESINANTDAEISAAIAALQTATGEARDSILAKLGSGGSSVIKSIQRGTISHGVSSSEVTATINAVNTAKTMLNLLGCRNNASDTDDDKYKFAHIELKDSKTIVVRRSGSSTVSVYVSYEVIEFN